jgi:hypothetical protein
MAIKKLPVEIMKKLPCPINLIKVAPKCFDYLDSDLKKKAMEAGNIWKGEDL